LDELKVRSSDPSRPEARFVVVQTGSKVTLEEMPSC
jgi:hypothetical protein